MKRIVGYKVEVEVVPPAPSTLYASTVWCGKLTAEELAASSKKAAEEFVKAAERHIDNVNHGLALCFKVSYRTEVVPVYEDEEAE